MDSLRCPKCGSANIAPVEKLKGNPIMGALVLGTGGLATEYQKNKNKL